MIQTSRHFDDQPSTLPADRWFGLLMAAAAAAATGYLFWTGAPRAPVQICAGLALGLTLVALGRPVLLRPLNRAWMALGHLMGRVVNPLVLGAIFFLLLTPVAWFMRLAGRDALALRSRCDRSSYWVERQPAGPGADSFKNQF